MRKCEVILVTHRRKYEAPRFSDQRGSNPSQTGDKVLGLMPNVGGPWPARRQLLATGSSRSSYTGHLLWQIAVLHILWTNIWAQLAQDEFVDYQWMADIVKRRGQRTFRGSSDQVASS